MEDKLAKYRARKEKEEFIHQSKRKIKNLFTLPKEKGEQTIEETSNAEEEEILISKSDNNDLNSELSDTDDIKCCSVIDIVYYLLWFIVWATVYIIFIKFQFGTVYLISSAIVGICLNTRTKARRSDEISAYSVFNKNCESIDGTLKAEQFEREIRFGRGIIHV